MVLLLFGSFARPRGYSSRRSFGLGEAREDQSQDYIQVLQLGAFRIQDNRINVKIEEIAVLKGHGFRGLDPEKQNVVAWRNPVAGYFSFSA
jgi:hypothetical protein